MPKTPSPIDQAISSIPGLRRVPHLAEYFGAWAMQPEVFQAFSQRVSMMDLSAHVRETKSPVAAEKIQGGLVGVRGGYPFSINDAGVAVVGISGIMMKFESSLEESTSTVEMRRTMRAMAADDRVKAVAINIDSPGGTVSGTMDLAGDVAALARVKNVIAYIDSLGASAAYYVASQARRIVAGADALVGSIGVYGVVTDMSKMAERIGIKVHVIRAGVFKGGTVPGVEISPETLADMQRIIDGFAGQFLEAVAKGRRMAVAKVAELADGRVHMGDDARRLGLIDAVGQFDGVLTDLSRESQPRPSSPKADSNDAPRPVGSIAPGAPDRPTRDAAAERSFLHEIKAALPDTDAEFRVKCVEDKLTIAEVKDRWMDTLRAQLESRSDELETANRKLYAATAIKPGIKPIGTRSLAGGLHLSGGGGDAIDQWNESVKALMNEGKTKAEAIRWIVVNDPQLHEEFLQASNARAAARRGG